MSLVILLCGVSILVCITPFSCVGAWRGSGKRDFLREVRKSTQALLRTLTRETLKASHNVAKFVANTITDLATTETGYVDKDSNFLMNESGDGDDSPQIGGHISQPVGVMVSIPFRIQLYF